MSKIIQILFLTLLVSSTSALRCTTHEQCEKDDPNSYCYQSRECARCTGCSIYNRVPGKKCAHDRDECGPCKDGWHAENKTDGTLSTCVPIITETTSLIENFKAPTDDDESKSGPYDLIIYPIGCILVLSCIVLIAWVIFKETDWCSRIKHEVNLLWTCDRPPPYSAPKQPTAPPDNYIPVFGESMPRALQVETQQAVPFQTPIYVQNGHLHHTGSNNDGPEGDVPGAVGEEEENETARLVVSEETQPSNWVPTTTSQSDQSPRLTFHNVLRDTSQLSISQPPNHCPTMPTAAPATGGHTFLSSSSDQTNSINIYNNVQCFWLHPSQRDEEVRCHQSDELSTVVVDAPVVNDTLCRSPSNNS